MDFYGLKNIYNAYRPENLLIMKSFMGTFYGICQDSEAATGIIKN